MISVRLQRLRYVLADLLSANAGFLLFNIYRHQFIDTVSWASLGGFLSDPKIVAEQLIAPLVVLGVNWLSGYYNKPLKRSRLQELLTTLFSSLLCTLIFYLALLTNDQTLIVSTNYLMLITLFGLMFVPTYIVRLCITSYTIRRLKKREWRVPSVIVGASDIGVDMARRLNESRYNMGYEIVGFVPIEGEPVSAGLTAPLLDPDRLPQTVGELGVKQIFIASADGDDRKVLDMVTRLYPLNTGIKIAPDTLDFVTSSIHLKDIYGEPFVDLTSPKISESSKNTKRLIDVVLSSLALTVLAIPCAVIALLVKRSSAGPVIYSQERIGYRQRPFRILKFRTMYTDAESAGPRLTEEADPRVTPIGRVLRKYRLDELPQFWNVLRGDMSIVGPRPERDFFIKQIISRAPYYTLVHQVRPGITSWGMVKYGYASTVDEMVARTKYDLIYLANMSISVDFKIMIYTVKTVVTGRGK